MGSIGVFDSGVGGFSILKDLADVFTDQHIFYVADQKHIPYSSKSKEFIINRAETITKFLISKGCSTIVIACNTATVFSINSLRESFKDTFFVGVEPAIKPAVISNDHGNVLVLATKSTIKSKRLSQINKNLKSRKKIFYQDMPEWVTWAEEGVVEGKDVDKYTHKKLSSYLDKNISSVVLACTHYPFFIKTLKTVFSEATFYDPSKAVAEQAKKHHHQEVIANPTIHMYTTSNIDKIKSATNLLPFKVEIESISL